MVVLVSLVHATANKTFRNERYPRLEPERKESAQGTQARCHEGQDRAEQGREREEDKTRIKRVLPYVNDDIPDDDGILVSYVTPILVRV
jgi:hypothetical protein